jgi:hypothetical protein
VKQRGSEKVFQHPLADIEMTTTFAVPNDGGDPEVRSLKD